jgi:hypothetical protein
LWPVGLFGINRRELGVLKRHHDHLFLVIGMNTGGQNDHAAYHSDNQQLAVALLQLCEKSHSFSNNRCLDRFLMLWDACASAIAGAAPDVRMD